MKQPRLSSFKSARARAKGAGAYTLIEIMLVLSIISILLGAGIFFLAGNVDSAKEKRVQSDIIIFTAQLKVYEMDNMFMPTTEQGLQALYQPVTSEPKPKRWRQLVTKAPIDPWGMPYQYKNPGVHNPNGVDIYSFGPTKKENDQEIGNW